MKTLNKRLITPNRMKSTTSIAACLLMLAAGPSVAQDSGLGEPQGRESTGEQGQGREEKAEPAGGQAMPDSRIEPGKAMRFEGTEAALLKDAGETEGPMESALGEGFEQPPVELTLGEGFDSGADQEPRAELDPSALAAASAEPFLVLVLRITRDGESEILSATEMVGAPQFSDQALSDFVFEIIDGDETLGTQALPGDPFEAHSFGGGPGSPEGHHFERLDETTVTVRVPKRSLDSALDGLSLNLYQLKAGPEVKAFSPSALQDLKRDRRLRLVTSISGAEIGAYVREKGTRVDEQQE